MKTLFIDGNLILLNADALNGIKTVEAYFTPPHKHHDYEELILTGDVTISGTISGVDALYVSGDIVLN